MRAIPANPVYTGYAVWKRTWAERELVDEDNLALGFAQHVRRAAPDQRVISIRLAHEVLITEEPFIAVQRIHKPQPDQVHGYQYTGLLLCGGSGRQMEGTRNNSAATSRCRHGHSTANGYAGRVPNAYIYVRESHLLAWTPLLHHRLTHRHNLLITAKAGVLVLSLMNIRQSYKSSKCMN